MDWQETWNKIVTFFENNVWNIILFFSTLVIGIIAIKILMMILKRIFRRHGFDQVASRFVAAIIRFFLWLVLILILLSEMGVPLSGITTSLSAVVLAIGMALKEFLSNVASGIILVGSRKYKTGDYIIAGGVEGSIADINFLFTTLKTPNSTQITLPNSTMVNTAVTNLGAYPSRRVAITFSVAYESDTKLVAKVVTDVMKSYGKIYLDPAPACRLKVYNASSLDYFATCFCDNADYWDCYYYVMEHVFEEFKRNGISVPFQQIEMRERKDEVVYPIAYEKLPPRIEKTRVYQKKKLTIDDWEDLGLRDVVAGEGSAIAKFKKGTQAKKERAKAKKKKAPAKKKPAPKEAATPQEAPIVEEKK